jgi:glycosyltransferase involved in cell wall biosynthesis
VRFLKIDLSQVKFSKNIFRLGIFQKYLITKSFDFVFIISDGSIPAAFAKKNVLHFQVPFRFQKPDFKTRLKLKRFNYVVCNSNFTKHYIDKSFGVDSKVIYPPVDIKSIAPGTKENMILSVGRFSQYQLHPKKQEILIEVFKEVYKENRQWRLVLIGQAKKDDQRYLRNLKKKSRGLAIKIIENPPFDKLRDYYAHASIYWHATGFGEDEVKNPERMEHFGIATVEASAAGAVPIVINRGGQKEIVEDGKNGLLWETKTILLEKTQELINNNDLRKKLSIAAVTNSKRFSQEVFFAEYEKIISK